MKLKHIISQLNRNYYANLIKRIQQYSIEERERRRLSSKISNGWYNTNLEAHLISIFWREAKNIEFLRGGEFKVYSELLGCNITISVHTNIQDWVNYYRCTELEFSAIITSCDNDAYYDIINKLNWNGELKVELDREDNNFSIGKKVDKMLSTKFYHHNSIFGRIQQVYFCRDKDQVKSWYKTLLSNQKDGIVPYCHDQVRRFLERRFNVEIWHDDLRRIGNMLAKDGIKYKEKKSIEKYDYSWILSFDGDVTELENEYYETLEDNTIYL